jgi:hypothetical protein
MLNDDACDADADADADDDDDKLDVNCDTNDKGENVAFAHTSKVEVDNIHRYIMIPINTGN